MSLIKQAEPAQWSGTGGGGATYVPPPSDLRPAATPAAKPDVSLMSGTLIPALTNQSSLLTMLGAAAAGGLAGGAYEAMAPGERHETPSQKRKRVLRNALLFAGGGGAAAAAGIGAYTLATDSRNKPPGDSGSLVPWLGAGVGATWSLRNKYKTLTDRATDKAEEFAANMRRYSGNDPAKNPPLIDKLRAWAGSDVRGLDREGLVKIIRQSGMEGPSAGLHLSPETIHLARKAGLPVGLTRGVLAKNTPMKERFANLGNIGKRNWGTGVAAVIGGLAPWALPAIANKLTASRDPGF